MTASSRRAEPARNALRRIILTKISAYALAHIAPCIVILSVSSLLTTPAHAQAVATGTVEGRVQNIATGASLENARVSVKGTSLITFTDDGGRYQLINVPSGPVVLRFFYTGLDEKEVTVEVKAGATVVSDVSLTNKNVYGKEDDLIVLDKFVVQASKETNASAIAVNEQRFARNITSVVSADEFGPILDNNPGELLKNLPGMDVEYFGGTIVSVGVRGLGAENTEINFDGMPTASANAQNATRGFNIQNASASEVSRVEIREVPLPEDSANSIGGSINMVRRTAFESSRRKITYSAFLLSDGDDLTTDKIDGPTDRMRSRWRPNWSVSWTEPITKDFGFAFTIGQNDSIYNVRWDSPGWNTGSSANFTAARNAIAAGQPVPLVPSLYNPALSQVGFSNMPYRRGSSYANLRLDWRPIRTVTLNWSVNFNENFKEEYEETRFRLNAAATGSGNAARFNGPGFTYGRVGGGAVRHENIKWRYWEAPTFTTTFGARWKLDRLELNGRVAWSKSQEKFSDTAEGFFESGSVQGVDGLVTPGQIGVGAGTANPIPLTIDFFDINYWTVPGRISVRTTPTGAASSNIADYSVPVDWQDNATWRMGVATSRPGQSKEIVTASKLFAKYSFDWPVSLQVGFDYSERFRNREYLFNSWRFVGADGIPNSPDDTADQIRWTTTGPRSTQYPFHPMTPERVNMGAYYDLFRAHPDWFIFEQERSYNRGLVNDSAFEFTENTYAPYVQFEAQLFNNRLQLTGGIRREILRGKGRGLKTDRSKLYMRYTDGSVVRANDASAPGVDGLFGTSDDIRMASDTDSSPVTVAFRLANPSALPVYRAGTPIFTPEIQDSGNALLTRSLRRDGVINTNADRVGSDVNSVNTGRGSLLHSSLLYQRLGSYGESEFEKNFPSLHAGFNVTENFVIKTAYAKTMSKLNLLNSAIPRDNIDSTPAADGSYAGTYEITNPDLKPWTADIYRIRLEYYSQSGGVLAFGMGRQIVSDFITSITTDALDLEDIQILQQLFPEKDFGIGLVGYRLRASYNESEKTRLDLADIQLRQSLDPILPDWSKGFTAGGSLAYANRKGGNSDDLGRDRRWRGTANLSYRRARFTGRINYTYDGQWNEENARTDGNAPGVRGTRFLLPQHRIDLSFEYAVTSWLKAFAEVRNLRAELRERHEEFPGRPEWAEMASASTIGRTYSIGMRGEF
jgi:TonB-dependent receptor